MYWMIAEDDEDILNLVAIVCRTWGHTPITFNTGQKAFDYVETLDAPTPPPPLPEFALMDIRMPGKRGPEVAARIRQVRALADIPIVLMTAFALNDEERADILSLGADRIIQKPLPDFDQLRATLERIIAEKHAATGAAKPTQPIPPGTTP